MKRNKTVQVKNYVIKTQSVSPQLNPDCTLATTMVSQSGRGAKTEHALRQEGYDPEIIVGEHFLFRDCNST
jgi:hypothetical protein